MHRQQLHTHTHARRRKGGAHGRSQGFLGTVLVNAGLSSPWQKEAVMSVPSGMRGRPNRAASAHTNACPPRKGGGYSRPLHTNPNSPPSSYISECPSMFERPVRTIPRPHGLSPCPDSRTLPREEGRCHPEPELLRFKYKSDCETSFATGGPPAGLSIRKPSNCLVGALCRSQGQCFLGLMHHAGHQAL